MAHELGHQLGSEHTHACVWNGNNTPIDCCGADAGREECDCNLSPPTNGPIMSYCHLTETRIDLSVDGIIFYQFYFIQLVFSYFVPYSFIKQSAK